MGIEPDWHVDAMMKAETLEGFKTSINTEFIIRMLGLGICSDTMVRFPMQSVVHNVSNRQSSSAMEGHQNTLRSVAEKR